MKIGCVGWGSLVWSPKCLPIRGTWFTDGPLLPIEFARQSRDGRVTLVLVSGGPVVRCLWALMSVDSLDRARRALAEREAIPRENINASIGAWSRGSETTDEFQRLVGAWAQSIGLDGAIWTALPPKFNGEDHRVPSAEEVVSYLSDLPYERRKHAEEYIRMTPHQIDTDYRREIEAAFQWSPLSAKR